MIVPPQIQHGEQISLFGLFTGPWWTQTQLQKSLISQQLPVTCIPSERVGSQELSLLPQVNVSWIGSCESLRVQVTVRTHKAVMLTSSWRKEVHSRPWCIVRERYTVHIFLNVYSNDVLSSFRYTPCLVMVSLKTILNHCLISLCKVKGWYTYLWLWLLFLLVFSRCLVHILKSYISTNSSQRAFVRRQTFFGFQEVRELDFSSLSICQGSRPWVQRASLRQWLPLLKHSELQWSLVWMLESQAWASHFTGLEELSSLPRTCTVGSPEELLKSCTFPQAASAV